ncbi:nuclease-related domain-containing protein [Thermococcus gorgonarius]|uniref:NERD domain-containing protein n=1 Tax=Thermococcus gorgonarius TaxID=71997 RepID=A0A2Z2M7L2_THEGO|nr:nuclease-related domain-containing protein [Thermococcus gorgonarius]ASJ00312.1 hypothetical protein A3K92_01870 [Thermococcus gorgonarius]
MIHTAEEAILWKKLATLFFWSGIVTTILSFIVNPLFLLGSVLLFGAWRYAGRMAYQWGTGFEGEYYVIEALSHSERIKGILLSDIVLPGRRANIDHVLICEQGIFAIETKAYTGIYFVSGDAWYSETPSGRHEIRSISKIAKRNAAVLSRFLWKNLGENYFVKPLVVFAGAGIVEGRSTIPVLYPNEIETYVLSLPIELSHEDITRLENLLEGYSRHVMVINL